MELLGIVLYFQKFQGKLIDKKFVIKTDSRASKFMLEKDVKNLVSKQIFPRWQVNLSCIDFEVLPIKVKQNLLVDYLKGVSNSKTLFPLYKLSERKMSFERGNTKGRLISTSSKGNRSSSSSNYAPSPMNANQYAMDLGFATVSRSRSRSKSSTPPRPSASLICPSCRVVQMRPHVSPSSNKESSTPSTKYS